jgi:hypothetical protein
MAKRAFLIPILSLALFYCQREALIQRVKLPPTPVLSIRSTWGVVTNSLVRVRQEPQSGSQILSHLGQGTIVEILSQTEEQKQIEDETDFWYEVNYEGLRGWLFGAYLEIFDSRVKAEAFAVGLKAPPPVTHGSS